jgi:hypothetical protein
MLSKYGVDIEGNLDSIKPSKVLKVISFTVESDYNVVIDEDITSEEVLEKFKSGGYQDSDMTFLTSRIYDSTIKVTEAYEWGGNGPQAFN